MALKRTELISGWPQLTVKEKRIGTAYPDSQFFLY